MADTNDKRRGSGLFHVDREMLPYKVTFSCFSGAHGAVPLFLPLYLREFGLEPQQIGVVLAQTSVGGLLGGLICGYASPQFISEKNAFTCGLLIKMWLVIIVCLMPTPPATGHCELPPDIVLPLNTSQSAREKSWLFDADVMSTNVVVLAVLVCGLGICYSGNHALVDTLTMNALGQNRRAEYGSQKAVGTLAHGIVSYLCGIITGRTLRDVMICTTRFTLINYHLVFYVYLVCEFGSILASRYLGNHQASLEPPPRKSISLTPSIGRVALMSVKNGSWLLVVYATSASYGISQGYLFWHMESLGATPFLLGNVTFVKILVECVAFLGSVHVLRRWEYQTVVCLGLTGSVIQFAIYAVIRNPIWVILVQILDGTVYCFIKCSLVAFASSVGNESDTVAVQGAFSALFCLGSGTGVISGGWILHTYGGSIMFAVCSTTATLCLILFILAQNFPERLNHIWKSAGVIPCKTSD